MTAPQEMNAQEWVEWLLSDEGKEAFVAAIGDVGFEGTDRCIGAESMPKLFGRVKTAVEALRRLRTEQTEQGAPEEQVIAAEAAIDALINLDAAFVHERFFTMPGQCPCRNCLREKWSEKPEGPAA